MDDDTVEVETISHWDVADDDERPTVRLRQGCPIGSPVERLLADAVALHEQNVILREK